MTLTKTEEALRDAYSQSKPLELGSAGSDSDSWQAIIGDAKRVIRASVIHDLLLPDTPPTSGQPRQLSITGAAICGPLNLQFVKIDSPVRFTHCLFDSQLMLSEARVRSMSLRECTAPGIDASHATVTGDLHLDQVWVNGPLRLAGAHLSDDLHLDDATIIAHGTESALDLTNIHVKGNIKAKNLTVHGKVSTNGASIDGVLTMTDAKINAGDGSDAWDGDGMKVKGELDATHLQATGLVKLVDARVLNLTLRSIQVENSNSALLLDRFESRGSVFCDWGSRITGGICAIGIQVGASLYLNQTVAQISQAPDATGGDASDVAAVNLCRARITGDLYCEGSFQSIGRFDLTGARIGGQVSLYEASLRPMGDANGSVAFIADRSEIGSDLYCDGDFQGTMSLKHAQVGGEMIINQRGKDPHAHFALAAPGLRVARNVDLCATGKVGLADAKIAGDITLDLSRLDLSRLDDPEKDAAADLSALSACNLILRGIPRNGFLDLTSASVSMLLDNPDDRPADSWTVLDGFVYSGIATPAEKALRYRLDWLKAGTAFSKTANGYKEVRFTPQPYMQLAAVWQRAGHDREGRQILCHMHREHNKAVVSWRRLHSKLWNWIQDVFLGYGYVPSRALLWVLVLGVLSAAWFTNNDIKEHTSVIEAAILSLGLILPGTRYNDVEKWHQMNNPSHLIAAAIVLCGLLLGATVLAALTRIGERRIDQGN